MVVTVTPIISLLIKAEVRAVTTEVKEEALHLINFQSIQSRFRNKVRKTYLSNMWQSWPSSYRLLS